MGLYKSKNLSKAKKTADKWFSRYVRVRDSDSKGFARCITCGKVKEWKAMDCGHFQSRRYLLTRYEEQNAHAQCQECNHWNSGEQYKHGIEIDARYGKGAAKELEKTARGMQKLTKEDVMELAREFKKMAEDIAKEKGLNVGA